MRVTVCWLSLAIGVSMLGQNIAPSPPLPSTAVQESALSAEGLSVASYEFQQDFRSFSQVKLAPDDLILWRDRCAASIISKLQFEKVDVSGLEKFIKSSNLYTAPLKDGRHIIVPCYVQKVIYKKKKAWLILNNWELFLEQYKGPLSLEHIMLFIVDAADGKLLYTDRCS